MTGILPTALPLSYSIYLYSSLVILRTVVTLSLFLADGCFWFYLCMYLHYWLVFLPLLLVTYMRHAFYLKSYCSVSLLSETSVGTMLWPFTGRQPNRLLPSVLLELSDGIRRFCDPFRALSSYLCGTCYFLYARWHWVFESPVFFDETVSILALGPQGFFCTYHFGEPVGF